MSCELFDADLKLVGFSNEPRCVYEESCPFANGQNINRTEASESCRALKDSKNDNTETVEDILQDRELRNLLCIKRLN